MGKEVEKVEKDKAAKLGRVQKVRQALPMAKALAKAAAKAEAPVQAKASPV